MWNVYELFRTRFNLHKRAYQHRVSHGIETMLVDCLLAAERGGFRLRGGVKPSRAMEDLDARARKFSRGGRSLWSHDMPPPHHAHTHVCTHIHAQTHLYIHMHMCHRQACLQTCVHAGT